MMPMNSRNRRQMQKMMKGMGMQDLDVKRVIFEFGDKKQVILNPKVVKMSMQGVDTFQVVGQAQPFKDEPAEAPAPAAPEPAAPAEPKVSEEDVKLIAQQTGASLADARAALEETGDLAAAILKLSS